MVHLSAVPAVAIALGAVLGLGLWLVAASAPRLGRARLVDRVAPYITDFSAEARAMRARPDADPASVIGMLVLPTLRRLRSIVGSVLGGNDRPLGDARVTLRMLDGLSPTEMTWTDARGVFELDRLPPGVAEIEIDHPDYVRQTVRASVGDEVVDIRLREGWTIEVEVRERGSDEPIEGAVIRTGAVAGTTDEDGRVVLPRLPGDTDSIAARNLDARYQVRPDGQAPLLRTGSSGGASHASRPADLT